jgi:RecB family exonuclease
VSADRVRFQVADPHGNTIVRTVDTGVLTELTADELAAVERVYTALLDAVRSACPHIHESDLPYVVAARILRHASDQAAYERVCELKGLLPL